MISAGHFVSSVICTNEGINLYRMPSLWRCIWGYSLLGIMVKILSIMFLEPRSVPRYIIWIKNKVGIQVMFEVTKYMQSLFEVSNMWLC